MASLTKVLLFAGPILLLFLVAIAGYAYSEILRLSLPISQILALFATFLPIATGISLQSAHRLLRVHVTNLGRTRPTIYLLLLAGFQLIYETVIATLALTYMIPPSSLHCGLEEQWMRLWRNKDETTIKRIQDRFNCCGFNTVSDRAWPFQSKEVNARECQRRFDRTQSCAGPWRQVEQINAGLILIVAAVIFVTKLIALTAFFTTSATANTVPWFRSSPFKRVTAGEVEDGRRLIEEGEPQQEYHDEADSGTARNGEVATNNIETNENRPRVEPSGLLGPGEGWRDEH